MGSQYHFLIETPEANLSRGMRQLNGVYTQSFNRRHRCVCHLFQGRYKAQRVEHGSYLLEVARYIVLNPVRAKMVRCWDCTIPLSVRRLSQVDFKIQDLTPVASCGHPTDRREGITIAIPN
jgi:hypothetical protein